MNQITIGDTSAGWLVLSGQSVAPPFKRAIFSPMFSEADTVEDVLELSLEGTPDLISEGLAALEKARQRAAAYDRAAYPMPQCLRFQPVKDGECFYTPISNLHFEFNPEGYDTHQTGSLRVVMRFTRPNHFDADQVELPLSNRNGSGVTGGLGIRNHTDNHAGHDSSVLIDPADFESVLPAPIRLELENTFGAGILKDVLVGVYHHPANDEEDIFFLHATDLLGGTQYYSTSAINDYYRTLSWSSTGWTGLGIWTLASMDVQLFAGKAYRPILYFFNAHAYDDLYLKIQLQKGDNILWAGDAVFADPSHRYLLFPPLRIPPHQILGEELPHHVDLVIYGQHEASGTYTIDIDQLFLLPLDASASFLGFNDMYQDDILIDDSFRRLHNVHYTSNGAETVAHLRQGGPLLITPGEYNRIFFFMVNGNDIADIFRSATVRAYYRKRIRLL
jgi:hypothetical protein